MDFNKYLLKFGFQLRLIRRTKGYSQSELAKKTGLSRSYIGMIERGEKNISLLNIYKIAKALNINVIDLFNENKNKKF